MPKIQLKSLEGFQADTPGIAGTHIVSPCKAALIDCHGNTVQAVHIGQRFTDENIRKAFAEQNDVAVNAAGVVFNGDAHTVAVADARFQKQTPGNVGPEARCTSEYPAQELQHPSR